MKDYRIEIKIKNNLLWQAMQSKGIKSAAELSRLSDIPQVDIGSYLNLKVGVFGKDGNYSLKFQMLCDFFNLMPTELYPEEQMNDPILNNHRVIEADSKQFQYLGHTEVDPTEVIRLEQRAEAVHKVIEGLTSREALVVKLRAGIDGDAHTLDEIGAVIGRSKQRVRQIHARALRKMRKPETLECAGLDFYTGDLVE